MRKNNQRLKRRLIALLVLVLAIFVLGRLWWNNQVSPISANKNTQVFVVAKGDSVNNIGDKLQKEGLIRSALIFKIYARLAGLGQNIQVGAFDLSPNMSLKDIAGTLSGKPLGTWVTLLEGWRDEEMAAKLNAELGIKSEEFLKLAKEGYMFPDTYLFPKEATAKLVADTLQNTFEQKYTGDLKAKINKFGLTDSEGVILASIVEREARSSEARTMVASILLKRLNIGMGLNADATVQYALIPKGTINTPADGWWKRNLTKDDLKVDSAYNTYIHAGLPPGPICNPSLSSLKAVANADPSTPYLYYYHDSNGVSHYARTLEEHNQNVANYP